MKAAIWSMGLILALLGSVSGQDDGNGRRFGVAVNPAFALFNYGSAEVNLWHLDRHSEINIPIEVARNPFMIDDDDGTDIGYFATGVNYRRFFRNDQEGLFAQAGWKFSRISVSNTLDEVTGSSNALMFGIGYRVMADNGFFWGMGINVGRQWGVVTDLNGDEIRGDGLALDVDLLKFGFAW